MHPIIRAEIQAITGSNSGRSSIKFLIAFMSHCRCDCKHRKFTHTTQYVNEKSLQIFFDGRLNVAFALSSASSFFNKA